MSKKVISLFVFIMFFSSCHLAYAGLIINEVMYDLSGSDSTSSKSREWIEIYNPDASDVSIDASEWRIYDGSANRTLNGEIDFSIPTQSYVIFAGDKDTFLADNPGFTGVVYDTGITSLNNTGATLKLLDQDGNTVDLVTYASSQGGAGDGNSLQKISGSWAGAVPTPGVTNENTTQTPLAPVVASSSGGGGGGGGSFASSPVVKTVEIKTKISTKTLAFVGSGVIFQASATGHSGEPLYYGKYFWNFGDGDSKEVKLIDSQKFTHTYFYPGEYVVSLEYYSNFYGDVPDASDKIVIKVIAAEVLISAVGDQKDFFVELTNNTNYEADISNWILSSSQKRFAMPRNTVIGPKKKIIISSKTTNFSVEDQSTLKLLTPQGEVVFDYLASITPVAKVESITIKPSKKIVKNETKIETLVSEIPVENLEASVFSSEVTKESSVSYSPAVALIFIGASAGAVYFIRRKGAVFKAGDDFKILDE